MRAFKKTLRANDIFVYLGKYLPEVIIDGFEKEFTVRLIKGKLKITQRNKVCLCI